MLSREAEELVEVHPGLVKQTDEKGNTLLAIACQNNKKVSPVSAETVAGVSG